jgi:hypothetical protein
VLRLDTNSVEEGELMRQYFSIAIALSILLIAAGCSSNSQTTAQQHPACVPGDQYPLCAQIAHSNIPVTAPYGMRSTTWPNNPEMRDVDTPPPLNPPLQLITPGISGTPWGGGFIR